MSIWCIPPYIFDLFCGIVKLQNCGTMIIWHIPTFFSNLLLQNCGTAELQKLDDNNLLGREKLSALPLAVQIDKFLHCQTDWQCRNLSICTAKLTEILWQCRNLSICTATINGINGFFHVSAETCLSALPQSKERGGKGGMGGKEGRQHRIGKPGAHLILTKAANAHRCRP